MRKTTKLALALVAAALAVSGCGSEGSSQEADRAAITDAIEGINTAVREKDGAAYCDLLEPDTFLGASTPDAAFNSKEQCAQETDQILDQAGDQPELQIEDISFEGDDAALASFTGRNGEARFVRVDDQWFLSLGAVSGSSDGASGPNGATGEDGG
jgi:ketosteroid isomerase-like protein